jgi:hypothetical protein
MVAAKTDPNAKSPAAKQAEASLKALDDKTLDDKALDRVSGGLFFNPQPDPPGVRRH